MANIAHILIAAADAIDTATADEMLQAVQTISMLFENDQLDGWNVKHAIQSIENEIEIRTANLLEDGLSYDEPELDEAIRAINAAMEL